MPDLVQSLFKRDIGFLRIAASLWGVELSASDSETTTRQLVQAMLALAMQTDIFAAFSAETKGALASLVAAGGKLPWAVFTRAHGMVREDGPGRRDREQTYREPISATEILLNHALVARSFFDTPAGALEFAYIPDDMLASLRSQGWDQTANPGGMDPAGIAASTSQIIGRPALPKEHEREIKTVDHVLDHAVTVLAAVRAGVALPGLAIPPNVIRQLLAAAQVLSADDLAEETGGVVNAKAVKKFLEMPRGAALALLTDAWENSESFNELRQVPGLACEGEWQNQPRKTRNTLLGFLRVVPEGEWWSLPAFVRGIKEKLPDFQRPAGDYDSWFVRRVADHAYLRGFERWDEVEGALIHYFISGPLFWLGVADLASPAGSEAMTAFRLNWQGVTSNENGKVTVRSNQRITVPRSAPRVTRYLIARFCEWESGEAEEYRYRVTTQSLARARANGLKVGQLLSLLARATSTEIPPAFVKALKRWEVSGTEARVESQTVLRVSNPSVLEELRKSKGGRFLGESLGPVTVIVKPGAQLKVLAALAEMGLLAEHETHLAN